MDGAPQTQQAPQNPFRSGDWRQTLYFVLLLVGGAFLTVQLLALLWPTRRNRNWTVISLVFSWWISVFPCLPLLFYAGRIAGPEPPFALCLASASLSAAQAPLVGFSAPCLIFHVWLIVRNTLRTRSLGPVCNAHVLFLLLVTPYLSFLVAGLTVLCLGIAHPERVHREILHCIVDDDYYGLVAGICCAAPLGASMVFATWILVLFLRNRMDIIHAGLDPSVIIRSLVIMVYVVSGFAFFIANAVGWTGIGKELFRASGPLAVFVVLGTQKSVWGVWIPTPHGKSPTPGPAGSVDSVDFPTANLTMMLRTEVSSFHDALRGDGTACSEPMCVSLKAVSLPSARTCSEDALPPSRAHSMPPLGIAALSSYDPQP